MRWTEHRVHLILLLLFAVAIAWARTQRIGSAARIVFLTGFGIYRALPQYRVDARVERAQIRQRICRWRQPRRAACDAIETAREPVRIRRVSGHLHICRQAAAARRDKPVAGARGLRLQSESAPAGSGADAVEKKRRWIGPSSINTLWNSPHLPIRSGGGCRLIIA